MNQYNIGPRIGIEGEAQFRQQISRINSEYRSMDSYLKTLDRSMAQNGKSQEALAAKGNVLRQQLALQEQRYNALSEALEKVRAKENASAQEIMRYEGALLDVKNTQAQLTRELADTEDEMRRLAEGIEDVGDSAEVAEPKMLSFGDVVKAGIASGAILNTLERVGEVIVDIGGQSIEAAADVKAANAQFQQTFGELEGRATSALQSVSRETGIAVSRLQGGYTALYAFTRSVGGDQETSLNIAQRALTAAADSAAYYDRTMEDATETLQSFLKGNYANDAALGIAATETTRNAKANELYAKSFKNLTEAQKVDTLLAMVEAGNAASGAMGQAAREADSWTNTTAELNEAWRQLLASLGSPIIDGLTPIIKGVTDALKGLSGNKDIDNFQDRLAAAEEKLADNYAAIALNADMAHRYWSRLQDLEEAGLDTADSQREYAQTVELLNELLPDLNLTIDSVTGRVKENTAAVEANIDALRRQAEQQAELAYYEEIFAGYNESYKVHYAFERQMVELREHEKRITEELAKAEQEAYDAASRGDFAARDAAADRARALQDELTALSGFMQIWQRFLDSAKSDLDDASAAVDGITDDYAALQDEMEGLAETTETQADAVAALSEAYAAAKNAARESIDSQIGLFDELADKNEWSADKIIKNWQKQREAFSNYEDNLKKAVELGLDETLIKQLSDGSQESMLILDAMVNDTKISVDEINAEFGRLSEAKDSVTGAMADVESIMSGSFDQMIKYAKAAGIDIVNGASGSILENIGQYENALKRLASRGQQAYRHEWDSHSPSRVMASMTDDVVDGAVLTLKRRTPDYERAMASFGTAGVAAYQDQLDHVAQYPSMMQVPGYGTSTTTNNRSVAYGGINITINAQAGQDAHSIADAVLEELTVRLGQEEAAF